MERRNGKSDALRDSLLEAASAYRYKREKRKYRGIRRVLVAKLVVESKNLGAEGRLLVRSVQGSTGFPFLEATNLWESVHSSLIVYLAAALNRVLPPVYVAVVEEWSHVPPPRQGIRPDIVIGNAPTKGLSIIRIFRCMWNNLLSHAGEVPWNSPKVSNPC